ncbi:MAG TPA: hypothetical protein VFA04_14325 [Bryobacteraceae bacterium]|nr:hypothetical protein [Bryobacteraceae bacterium]
MGAVSPRFDEVCVVCTRENRGDASDVDKHLALYVYSTLPGLAPEKPIDWDQLNERPLSTRGGLPLVGVGKVLLDSMKFAEVRRSVRHGQTPSDAACKAVLKWNDSCAAQLAAGIRACAKPVRVWWAAADLELAAFPWETLAARIFSLDRVAIVRGAPPEVVLPRVPVKEKPRLALIYDPATAPARLIAALEKVSGPQLVKVEGSSPRENLQKAVEQGVEMVHLVARATVSLAHEGMLALPQSAVGRPKITAFGLGVYSLFRPLLSASLRKWLVRVLEIDLEGELCSVVQLSDLLRGKRLTVLGISPTDIPQDQTWVTGLLPSTYRSYCALGMSGAPLPTIVAPLGPIAKEETFWPAFYENIASSLSVENALTSAAGPSGLPVAVFLRHRLRRQFMKEEQAPRVDPTAAAAQIAAADQWLGAIKAVAAVYGDHGGDLFAQVVQKVQDKRNDLRQDLTPYVTPEEASE